tara:strand:- start:1425 stop:2207 length:783 start_codon:yes stop_codon:yes gene_type:complete
LNILGTIDKPTKGSLDICGAHVSNHSSDRLLADLRLRHIGFVFQTFNLLPALTAIENVELPMVLSGRLSTEERRSRAVDLLTQVGLGHRLDHVPSQLSGGEQQRVAIARSIANKPELLLLDEPTGDLDTVNSALVMQHLIRLNREDGITIIMVTHDVAMKFFADRVIWLRDGKIQRVEMVSDAKREESMNELNRKLEDIESMRVKKKDLEARNGHSEHSNVGKESSASGRAWQYSVREPTDYKTHIDHDKRTATPLKGLS